jgi:TP901 family phage tail tape measure protein
MAKPYEQDVILDADGKALFGAMDLLERRIKNIQKTISQIQKDSYKTVQDLNKTVDANIKALQKSQGQMRTLSNIGATDRQVTRTLARSTAQADVARYGTTTTRVGYELELEKKLEALRAARTEKEKRAALEAVTTANARLRAVQQIEAAENRAASAILRGSATSALSGHRQRLALSRQYAEGQIRTLGTEEAIRVAIDRQRIAETRLGAAQAHNREELRRNLELENARLRATERLSRAQNGGGGGNGRGGGGVGVAMGPDKPSRLQNILSPGYAVAAFARTSIYGAAAAAAYGAFNTVSQAVSGVVQLEDALQRLQAISNSTDTQMQTLKATIFEIGKESRFSLTELAEAAQILAQAGVSAGAMESVLRSVTTLATASGSTIDEAAQLVTSAVGSFQLQSNEAGRVADLMTNALNRTKLTVQQTAQAIQYVGATAYEQNISLEQLLGTIGAIAQAGVRSGSTIGTGFRQFLVDLADPSKKLSEQLELLGIKSSEVNVAVRGLPAVLDTLSKAGFGAAQAYQGMETRAAAFYLIAKNNVDIMDQLQLSFVQQGASATANERAMSSLAAQWQRFKNILQSGFASDLESTMNVLKALIRSASDRVEEMRKEAEARRDRQQKGYSAYGNAFEYADENLIPDTLKMFGQQFRNVSNLITPGAITLIDSWTTSLVKAGQGANNAGLESERLKTKISDMNDRVSEQRNLLSELDKELLRVITQKATLRDNETRVATETATLSSKFKGLALNLTNTSNSYDDLITAMKEYRKQQVNLLNTDLLAQQSNLVLQNANSRTAAMMQAGGLLNDPAAMKKLGPDVQQALRTAQTAAPGSREFNNAQNVLVDAVNRFANSDRMLADRLNNVVQSLGTIASNTAELRSIKLQTDYNRAAQTEVGQNVVNTMREVEAAVAQIGSMSNDEPNKKTVSNQALNKLANLDRLIGEVLKRSLTESSRQFLNQSRGDVASLRTQINALNTATSDEVKAAKAAEREAQRGRPLTQADLDRLGKAFTGLALGSGPRTATEQNRLHALGLTPATAGTSSHSNGGVARDFPTGNMPAEQAKQLAQALRNYFKNLGVDVFVQWESGHGRNQGTGPHIHTSAKKGTRFKGSDGGSDAAALDKFEDDMQAAQLGLDKREFNEALKDAKAATTVEAQHLALSRARAAMDKVNDDLRKQAENELAKGGIGPGMPQYKERMNQLQDAVQQNIDEFSDKVSDILIKNAQNLIKAAGEAFEAAIAPAQRDLAMAQGALSGLDYISLQGRVPDYTRQLAQQQVARRQEAVDRSRLANLPAQIAASEAALSQLAADRDSGIFDSTKTAQMTTTINELTNSLEGLKATRDSLSAAFGAEGLLPKTLNEGLTQAIEAYRQLNGLNLTFTEQLNNEMTGAIGAVHQGLEGMFASVLDGSATAGQAVLGFARSMISAIGQIVAKILATQVIKLIFSIFGAAAGGFGGGSSGDYTDAMLSGDYSGILGGGFRGGPASKLFQGGPAGYRMGGHVSNGHSMRDSVMAMLSKGEWVINKRAVDSVGHDFMADLNARGSQAVDQAKSSTPTLEVRPEQKVNVWMVKPEDVPSMGPNDVLVTWQSDVLQGGQSRKLIESIAREAK